MSHVHQHTIPHDTRFAELLKSNHIIVTHAMREGKLPIGYDTFVNNLFKQLCMVDIKVMKAAIEELIKDTGGSGYVNGHKLIGFLQIQEMDPDASAMHAAIGCAGEGGELLDCVKKVFLYKKTWDQVDPKTNQTPLENLLEELADYRFYYQKLLNMLGITDAEVKEMSYAKLMKRYADGKYSDAQAQARADKAHELPHIGRSALAALPDPAPARTFIGQPQPDPLPQRRKDDTTQPGQEQACPPANSGNSPARASFAKQ